VGDLADTSGLPEAGARKEKLGPWREKKKKGKG
jgi:pyruvate kinase